MNKAFDNQIRREHRVEFFSVFNIEITKETKTFILKKKQRKKEEILPFYLKSQVSIKFFEVNKKIEN